jgi:hypothetical protein
MSFPETVVRLCSNVPLSSTYEHVMDFSTKEDQTNYFTQKAVYSFSDFTYQRQEQVIKVPVQIDKLYEINYLMYQNKDYSSKWFYGFITRKEYVNPNTTAIYFQLDVYQTWLFDFSISPSYVVREHTNRWQANGLPVVNTIDENLNYGTNYETVSVERYTPFNDIFFLVVVSKSSLHSDPTGPTENEITPTVNGLPQPLSFYLHPFKMDGSEVSATVGGQTLSSIQNMLRNIFSHDSAVNNIVSMYITEAPGRYLQQSGNTISFDPDGFALAEIADNVHENIKTAYVKNMGAYEELTHNFGSKYSGFRTTSESKLMMYPYCVTVLDDLKGNRIEIKNEYIEGSELEVRVRGSLGTSNKVSYSVENYLKGSELDYEEGNKVAIENAVVNSNPNDLPILNDYLSAFLQGNRNTLQVNRESMIFNAFTGLAGAAFGGGLGALGGLAATGGNSYFQIASLNAKLRDISNTPPNLASLGGNVQFEFGHGFSGLFVIKKQITKEYQTQLEQFFKMYGYKVNALKVPNLRTREHFNYVQTEGVKIKGNIPSEQLQELANIFDSGVTIWHGDFIGNYAFANNEV